ncbi:MAG: hypothetical protein BWY78_01163 [Alphaproteobacteria bacterium ADurb.Bin438]|nr:MAG: hypothetical protein BWY78_01163 [Alphaproteobacteria bacterium ADurb.Bin438]
MVKAKFFICFISSFLICLVLYGKYKSIYDVFDDGYVAFLKVYSNDKKDGIIRYKNIISEAKLTKDDGKVVISLDENNEVKFLRLYDKSQLNNGEKLIDYHIKHIKIDGKLEKRIFFGPSHYEYKDEYKKIYEKASFVVLRIGKDGKAIFAGFADANYQSIILNN